MRVFSKYCQLSFIILLMGCAVARADADDRVELISAKEASVTYTEKKAVIVDVREDSEWNEQHIPVAIPIPLGS
jgi:Rhodanese-like domain